MSRVSAIWRNRTSRDVILLLLAVLAITVPFINKAFDWDDREFIEFAEVFSQNPLQLHLENLSYKGQYYEEFRTSHPPLPSEYLSLFLRLGFTVSEPLFRLAYTVFPAIAAVSMYALARRFTRHALMTTLLLIVTPAFLVTSHTLMGDMPGLAMWLLSVALYIHGADRRSWKLLLTSGMAMAIAVLTAYQAISVIPLLILYALINRRFHLRAFVPFLIPIVAFGLYSLYVYHNYQGLPVLAYRVGVSIGWENPDLKARALLVFMGGGMVFAPAALALFFRTKWDLLLGFLLLPPLITWAAIFYLSHNELGLYQALLVALMAAAGFAFFYGMIASAVTGAAAAIRKRKWSTWPDSFFLLVWLAGVLIYAGLFLPFVAERFLLPLVPPAILLFVRGTAALWTQRPRWRTAFIGMTIGLTFFLAIGAGLADYRLANAERAAAQEMAARYGASGRKLWVLGEFGFRYYMQKESFEYMGIQSEAHSGDIVISSRINSEEVVAPLPSGFFRILETKEIDDSFPVRVMNKEAGAGFYSHRIGPIPYVFSKDTVDEVTVYELVW